MQLEGGLVAHPHLHVCATTVVNGFYQHWLHPMALTDQIGD